MKTMSNPCRSLVLCVALVISLGFSTADVHAQASIGGTVEDHKGQPVDGAVVTVRPLLDSALRTQVTTDADGRFRMENFNPSRGYRFQVSKEGYRTLVRDVEAGLGGESLDGILNKRFVLFPIGVAPGQDKETKLVMMTRQSSAVGPYQKGVRALDRGDLDKARQRLERARDLDPKLAPVHEALSLVYHRQGDYDAALVAADKALEFSPWDPDYLRIRYEALRSLGRTDEARQALDRLAQAAADTTTAIIFHNDGVAAIRAGDHETAETMLRTALRLEPDMLEAKDALAKLYAQTRRFESALVTSEDLIAADPGNVEILRLRHEAWSALGRTEEALQALDALVTHDPGPRTATLLYNEGVAAFNAEDNTTAEQIFSKALGLDPQNLQARLGLAETYLRQKRYEECLAETQRILAQDPTNAHAQRVGQRAEARMGSAGE